MLSQGIIPALNVGYFPRFFANRIMLLVRNNDLISFPVVNENKCFFISEWYAIPEYSACLFTSITTRIRNDLSSLSAQCDPDPNFAIFLKGIRAQFIHFQHRCLLRINRCQRRFKRRKRAHFFF